MRASHGVWGNEWSGRRLRTEDRGAALPFITIAVVFLLLGMAALAIDVGAGFNARRQDQSASDVASLAAVQFANGSPTPLVAANNGANEAIVVANASLDDPSLADWVNCVDPTRPANTRWFRQSRRASLSPPVSSGPGFGPQTSTWTQPLGSSWAKTPSPPAPPPKPKATSGSQVESCRLRSARPVPAPTTSV